MKVLRFIGILVGLSLLGYLLHQVGLSFLRQSLGWLGWGYVWVLSCTLLWDWVNTIGFQRAFPKKALNTSFLKLFEIRIVGETFNALIPSGYMGGEPLKIRFLSDDMSVHEASSSVMIAKVAQSLSLVLYLILGLTVTRPGPSPLRQRAAFVSVCGLALGIVIFAFLIARGCFSQLGRFLHRWTRHPWFKHQEERLLALDTSLREFFRYEKKRFIESLFWHSAGWFMSAMEVPLILYLMGHPITWREGWFMAAMAQLGSSVGVAVPGGIGFFEGGHYLAASLLGFPPSLGLSVALIRRVREIFWDGIGLLLFWHLSKERKSSKWPEAAQVE